MTKGPMTRVTMTNGGPFEGLVPNLSRVCAKAAVVMCKGQAPAILPVVLYKDRQPHKVAGFRLEYVAGTDLEEELGDSLASRLGTNIIDKRAGLSEEAMRSVCRSLPCVLDITTDQLPASLFFGTLAH
jgi:hypothetical protein